MSYRNVRPDLNKAFSQLGNPEDYLPDEIKTIESFFGNEKRIYCSYRNKGKNIMSLKTGRIACLGNDTTAPLQIQWEGLNYFHMNDNKMYLKTEYIMV